VYSSWLTPITNIFASFEGAEIITFLAPPVKCADAFSVVVNTPEDSTTYSTPASFQGISFGSLKLYTLTVLPFITKLPSSTSTLASNLP